MVHIALGLVREERIQPLSVAGRAQGGDGQHVGFATHKEAAAMHTGHFAHLHLNRTDFGQCPAIGTHAVVQNAPTHGFLDNRIEDILHIFGCHFAAFHAGLQRFHHLSGHNSQTFLAVAPVVAGDDDFTNLVGRQFFDQCGGLFLGQEDRIAGELLFADLFLHLLDGLDDGLHGLVGQFQRFQHHIFGQLVGSRFHHQNVVLGPGDLQGQGTVLHFRIGGVDDELAVHVADRGRTHRSTPGNVADGDGCRSRDDSQGIEKMFGVRAERVQNQLYVVAETLGKEGAQGTIHQAAEQNALFAGAAFAPEEAAGDAAHRVHLLFKVHREWEEVDARSHILGHGGGRHNHRIATAHSDRTA